MSQRSGKRIPKLSLKASANPSQFSFMAGTPKGGDVAPAGAGSRTPDEGQIEQPAVGLGDTGQNLETGVLAGSSSRDPPPVLPTAPVRTPRAGPGSVVVPDEGLDDGQVLSNITMRDLSAIITAAVDATAQRAAPTPAPHTSDITRGEVPKWDRKSENFVTFEQRVVMWMRSHDIEHLLTFEPGPDERKVHNKAVLVITSQLNADDQTTVHKMSCLCEMWAFLLAKNHPSDEADRSKLWTRFDNVTKGNRSVRAYHSEIISLVAQLTALDQPPPPFLVRQRMFRCGPEFDTIKFDLEDKLHLTPAQIMAKYVAHEERHGLRAAGGPGAPAGGQGPGGRRGNQPRRQGQQQQVLGVGRKYLDPKDGCANCGSKDHFKRDCPQLPEEVRRYLNAEADKRKAAAKAAAARKRT